MTEEEHASGYLPYQDFIQLIQEGDFDTSPLRASLEQLKKTAFGRHLAEKLDVVTSNTGAHAIVRGELDPSKAAQEFYPDNPAIRQIVANRVQQATGYRFSPQVTMPETREGLRKAIEDFTGIHADQETVDEINLKIPDKYIARIYRVPWIGEDEVAIGSYGFYYVDASITPGHVSEYTYTVFKGGKQEGRLSFAAFNDENEIPTVYTRFSGTPLSQRHFTDRVSGGPRYEFIYANPQSLYLKAA